MKNIFKKKDSIVFKLTSFAIGITVIQSFLIITILILSGVIQEARSNAYKTFSDSVQMKKSYLELEMKNRWMNLGPHASRISENLSIENGNEEEIFEEVLQDIIYMLRTTQSTGAYLILDNRGGGTNYPGIHLRDYDPMTNNYSYNDIYMVTGPPNIARKYSLALDRTWKYDFEIGKENGDFILKPSEKSDLSYDPSLLGYISEPFKMREDDLELITYSMPIYNDNDEFMGVIGIELTLNYINQVISSTYASFDRDSIGYMISHKENEKQELVADVMVGDFQNILFDPNGPLEIEIESEDYNLYRLLNHKAKGHIYTIASEMEFYQFNTPFESESWYLYGFMHENKLLSYVYRIQNLMGLSFILVLVLGIVGGSYFSYRFSRPIVRLSDKIRKSDKDKEIGIDDTGISEVDNLAKAMIDANNERIEIVSRLSKVIGLMNIPIGAFEIKENSEDVFITERVPLILEFSSTRKKDFKEHLDKILKRPEEQEENVYIIGEEREKWVRIVTNNTENSIVGVVEDVTEEIRKKLEILKDRDIDSLTRLYNHRAFKENILNILDNKDAKVSALIMFDLDNLKIVNDTFGHKWGDYYIQEGVEQLKKFTSKDKMVLGRRSGDEFVLLLYGFNSRQEIRDCTENFFNSIKDSLIVFPDNKSRPISISAGLVWIDLCSYSYDDLLHKADIALYESKSKRKGYWTENI